MCMGMRTHTHTHTESTPCMVDAIKMKGENHYSFRRLLLSQVVFLLWEVSVKQTVWTLNQYHFLSGFKLLSVSVHYAKHFHRDWYLSTWFGLATGISSGIKEEGGKSKRNENQYQEEGVDKLQLKTGNNLEKNICLEFRLSVWED